MNLIAIFLLVIVAFLAALGNLFFKKAALSEKKTLLAKMFTMPFILGGILFVACPVISSFCARYLDFSILYSMTALNFVFILLLSKLFLSEKIDKYKNISDHRSTATLSTHPPLPCRKEFFLGVKPLNFTLHTPTR